MRNIPNYDVVKEPRGFIKALQIFLSVFAFSCAAAYRGKVEIKQSIKTTDPGNKTETFTHIATAIFKYPFDEVTMNIATIDQDKKVITSNIDLGVSETSSTQFFMVIAVFCFLYSLCTLAYYVLFEVDKPAGSQIPNTGVLTPPVIDFCIGTFWAFFWFCAACAQASAVHRIKEGTDVEKLVKDIQQCIGSFTCTAQHAAKYANLTVSILMGFLNCFVWAGNMWFLWKETPWHRGNLNQMPATVASPPPPQQVAPPAAAI